MTCSVIAFSQKPKVSSEILTTDQVAKLFPDSICKALDVGFSIFRVYRFTDKAGEHYCILAESRDEITADMDTLNHRLKATCVRMNKGSFSKIWEINDKVIANDNNEKSIWFWSKYCDFNDYDGDGLADPIIVYGTSGTNGYDDGRIKFITLYKKQKVAIRHQNGVLDYERETKVDKAFYILPLAIQEAIRQKMKLMLDNNQAIFPAGWQTAMKNKKTIFNERQ
jgi:hypothetical protein